MVQEEELMMSSKNGSMKSMIISLLISVILLVGLLVGAFAMGGNDKLEEDDDLVELINCTEEDINKITIQSKRDAYTIKRTGVKQGIIQWEIENQDNTDVDLFALKTIANRCYKLNARRELGTIDTNDKKLMQSYGFAQDSTRFTIDYKDGIRTFVIGDQYGSEYYMYEVGTDKFYMAPSTVGAYFNLASSELRVLPALSVQMGNVGVISIARKGQSKINLAYMPSVMSDSLSWQMIEPVGGYTDAAVINELTKSISDFKMSMYVASELGDNKETYGFDDPYATLILAPFLLDDEYKDKNALSQVIYVGDPVAEIEGYRYCYTYAVKEGETVDQTKCKVYAITEELFKSIFDVKAIDVLDKQVVLTNITDVKSIELEILGKKEKITITQKPILDDDGEPILDAGGEKSYDTAFTLSDNTEIDPSNARAFYLRLISLKVVAFVRDDDPQEIGDKLFSMKFNTNLKIYGDDSSDTYAEVTAEVYELDSNYCILRFRGQDSNACKMYKSQLLELIDAYDLMLKGELPPIRAD